jgi:uncharacterized protein (DUF488 family)
MSYPFYTIGHSTRSFGEFATLLKPHNIALVIDVRTVPRSRTNPRFNSSEFMKALSRVQIDYLHIPSLGGLRGRTRDLPRTANAFWKNESFHNYADYAMTGEFRAGLTVLRELGQGTKCTIMCAELVWWRCHRRIIADYLITAGEAVFHILGPRSVDQARLTEGARVGLDGTVSYPAADTEMGKKLAVKR